MGTAKPLSIAGRPFATLGKATKYFQDQRQDVKGAGLLTEGELFTELTELYTRYCELYPTWALNGRNITAFSVDYELRENGRYGQYLCYRVHFSNKEIRPFSIPKALTAVVNGTVDFGTV